MKDVKFLRPNSPETMIPALSIGLREGEVEIAELVLDLGKVNQTWKQDQFNYSGFGGNDRKENKINGVKKCLDDNGELYSPIIYITCENPNNLFFVDGRHTTAYLYESGYESALFIVPRHQRELIESAFGPK